MRFFTKAFSIAILTFVAFASLSAGAQTTEKRIALVVGNANYPDHVLRTTANDGGLIAQTLEAAGFEVVGARDLDAESLRRAFKDFVQKAQASGPDTVAFVYLAGYGMQLAGENYFVPVDAAPARDTDIAVETLRLSDYIRQLQVLSLKAGIVVLDAAREHPFAKSGQPLAGGFALVEPDPRIFTAFNAAPGTVAPEAGESYSPYAQALAEMIRTGGLTLPEVFDRVRLRVNDVTKGAQMPWDTRKIDASVMFFERAPDAPQPATNPAVSETSKPISAYDANAAYTAALARDTLPDYDAFVAAYPSDPLAKRVRAIIAARREAITWRRSYLVNTPESYWSYLRRYPRGPHAFDARRRLAFLTAPIEPPPTFATIAYDVPPPPPEEIVYVERPVLIFSDPDYAFAPPPPPPIYFLPPPPPDFIVLEPPPPVFALFILPRPRFVPIPVYVVAPRYVVPPVNNPVFTHIHNAPAINNAVNRPPLALPPSVAQRASLIQQGKLQPPAGVMSRGPGAPATGPAPARLGAPLPRVGGSPPLPGGANRAASLPPPGVARGGTSPQRAGPPPQGTLRPAGTPHVQRPAPATGTPPQAVRHPNPPSAPSMARVAPPRPPVMPRPQQQIQRPPPMQAMARPAGPPRMAPPPRTMIRPAGPPPRGGGRPPKH